VGASPLVRTDNLHGPARARTPSPPVAQSSLPISATEAGVSLTESPRLHSEQSTPGNDGSTQMAFNTQSDQDTRQPPPPSPLAASQRPYRIQLSRAKRNFMVTVLVQGSLDRRCTFYRCFLLFCSLWANSIRPQGRTRSSFSKLMTECPQKTGKHFSGSR
jgi:hypothetical protein